MEFIGVLRLSGEVGVGLGKRVLAEGCRLRAFVVKYFINGRCTSGSVLGQGEGRGGRGSRFMGERLAHLVVAIRDVE